MNHQDIAAQVTTTLGDHSGDFDVNAIVDDLVAAHDGDLSSIDDFSSESYWAIVETHDTSASARNTKHVLQGVDPIKARYLHGGE